MCIKRERERERETVCKTKLQIDKEIVLVSMCVCVCVCREKDRWREITALLHLCYTFVTLFITSLLRNLWHFVRIPAFTVEFLLQTHPI